MPYIPPTTETVMLDTTRVQEVYLEMRRILSIFQRRKATPRVMDRTHRVLLALEELRTAIINEAEKGA